ncbi:MAG: DUF1326 domain-containing protein [Nitrososphaeraceae archaeon]
MARYTAIAANVSCILYQDTSPCHYTREALQMIFGGKAGGFMAEFAKLIGEVRGLEFAPISRRILTMLL